MLPPDAYWGGYTEHGELLHFAVASQGGVARSACGLLLTGGAWAIPEPMWSERCKRCVAAEERDSQFALENDRIWGQGNWIRCSICPPDTRNQQIYHHRHAHE